MSGHRGGGINTTINAEISGVRIDGCRAESNGTGYGVGGGICISESGHSSITDTRITNCYADGTNI